MGGKSVDLQKILFFHDLEFPQNYPHKTNLLRLLSTTFKKCPKYKESCSFPQNYPHKTNLLRLLSTTFKKCPKYKESCSFLM